MAPTVIVPAAAEHQFYQLNNLPEQITDLFRAIDLHDPDEDDLEDVVPEVQALLRSNFLLDEFIDSLYRAIRILTVSGRIRRAGSVGRTAVRGRPTLMSLRDLWFEDWGLESLRIRLQRYKRLNFKASPVLIQPPQDLLDREGLTSKTQLNLDPAITLYRDPEYGITRVQGSQPKNAS
ncbi:MAG: hypothetical protein JSV66_09350 [Trueperaceae bacterium]|nr:MAG: hypothetical protein JSV66_09350 [Trueperaceae bacterium]